MQHPNHERFSYPLRHRAAVPNWYYSTVNHKTAANQAKTLICVRYATGAGPDNVSRSSAVSAFFALLVGVPGERTQNNIRSADGTPVDSVRFRQALRSTRQAQ